MTEKHGHRVTKDGTLVHRHTHDFHPSHSAYQRFNKQVALALTKYIGTMTCFWVFCLLALCSLPAVLSGFHVFAAVFPIWMTKASDIALVAWIAQTFIQLVLLPALMVGQSLQNEAADARASKAFEDTELIVDRLDEHTAGGIKTILDRLDALEQKTT